MKVKSGTESRESETQVKSFAFVQKAQKQINFSENKILPLCKRIDKSLNEGNERAT